MIIIKKIDWIFPTNEEIWSEFKNEEWIPKKYKHDLFNIIKKSKIKIVDHNKISVDNGRGVGDDPPKNWILDKNSVPECIKNDERYGEFRYYHKHHEKNNLIYAIKNHNKITMPIIVGDSYAVSGRHRIAYSKVLNIKCLAVSIGEEYWTFLEKIKTSGYNI